MAADSSTSLRLVGRGELLKMLGVSATRLVQITGSADFPPPVADLMSGKIWALEAVQAWAAERGRVLYPMPARTGQGNT